MVNGYILYIAMRCNYWCVLHSSVSLQSLRLSQRNKYSAQKGKSSSSQPPAKRSRQVSLLPAW